jgi:hypothetical protein
LGELTLGHAKPKRRNVTRLETALGDRHERLRKFQELAGSESLITGDESLVKERVDLLVNQPTHLSELSMLEVAKAPSRFDAETTSTTDLELLLQAERDIETGPVGADTGTRG